MGVSYVSFVLNDEMANWLRENNVPAPSPLPSSRMPTLGELKSVVQQLDGYMARIFGSSEVTKSVDLEVVDQQGYHAGWSTTIWATKLDDPTQPPENGDVVQFNFHKGSPELAILIVEKLARICGPLVLVQSNDALPLLVTEGMNPQDAVDQWLSG